MGGNLEQRIRHRQIANKRPGGRLIARPHPENILQ